MQLPDAQLQPKLLPLHSARAEQASKVSAAPSASQVSTPAPMQVTLEGVHTWSWHAPDAQ